MLAAIETLEAPAFCPIDGNELEKALYGATVMGADTVDDPLTDGLVLHLKGRNGAKLTLEILIDEDFLNGDPESLYSTDPPLRLRLARGLWQKEGGAA